MTESSTKHHPAYTWALLLVLAAGCIFLRFPDFFQAPNSKVIEPWGDGFKSYLALVYHIKYDTSYRHTEAMNYPYGEHVIPGDAQPAISNTLKALSHRIPETGSWGIGVMHFSLLLSILGSVIFLFLIFRRLGLPWWMNIPVAIGITFLSPPTERLIAHYGLAHPAALAGAFYLLLRWEERRRWRYSIAMALLVWFFSLIHFYFFAILTFVISGYFAFSWLQKRKWNLVPSYLLHYGVQIGLPLAFFAWWMIIGDPVDDRTAAPWGYFHYCATPDGVFASLAEPQFKWLDEHLIHLRRVDFEGKSYVGLVATLFFLFLVGRWVRFGFRRLPVPAEGRRTIYLNAVFFTGLALLLFSFGLPFTIKGLEPLLDYTGPLRQFRSIGRFAWAFYFAINIITFVGISQWQQQGPKWRRYIAILAILILAGEAWFFTRSFDVRLDDIEEFQPGHRYTDLQIDYKSYQAILPIPYYNIGSDNFWWNLSGFIGQKSQTLGMQTGLPTTGAMLTRTSLSQTIKQLQLVTEPYRLPLLLRDLPNGKPLLMAWDTERVAPEQAKYAHLLEDVQLLYENPPLQLYKMPLESFQQRILRRRADAANGLKDSTNVHQGDWILNHPSNTFIYNSFDTLTATQQYMGKGGYEGQMGQENIIFEGPVPDTGLFIFSVWMLIEKDLYPRTEIRINTYDPVSGVAQQWVSTVKDAVKVFDNNGWALIEMPVHLTTGGNLRWIFQNTALHKAPLWLDELLIRPEDLSIYATKGSHIFFNNRWYDR